MAESPNNKDVIYVDIDDEITGIIDKVRSAKHQIVALVLPKRATILQSIVNMKLLKRTADEAKKHIVLITSEDGLLPLAGSVGMHVARSLQTKPEIPTGPPTQDSKVEEVEEAIDMEDAPAKDLPVDKTKPVGELAGLGGAAALADDDAIELDNSDDAPADKPQDSPAGKGSKKSKKNKNKSLKIPNFNKFRSWLLIGGVALVVFIALLYVCLTVLPKATIAIETNSQTVNTSPQVTLNTNATDVSPGASVVPAQVAQTQKTYTGQANTTGQQNNGTTATGTVAMQAQECAPNLGQPPDVPAGTGLSANGLTFITQADTSFNAFGSGKGSCLTYQATGSTAVSAQSAGAKYNVNSASFSVSGRSDASANGSTSGGSDNIVQVVAQADINTAQSKISTDNSAIKSQLESDLQSEGLDPIPATFTASSPTPTDSAAVGAAANSVTVTENITYTMFGAKRSDLQQIIASGVDSQISTSSQKILNYGLSTATFSVQSQSSGTAVVNMQVSSLVGSALNTTTIRNQSAGEKPGTAEGTIRGYAGVTNVSVRLSPFWVSSIPKNTSKITVNIENPQSK
jgi:hypothetical protein